MKFFISTHINSRRTVAKGARSGRSSFSYTCDCVRYIHPIGRLGTATKYSTEQYTQYRKACAVCDTFRLTTAQLLYSIRGGLPLSLLFTRSSPLPPIPLRPYFCGFLLFPSHLLPAKFHDGCININGEKNTTTTR